MLQSRVVMSAILILGSKALKIDWEQRETPSLILLSLVILLLFSSFIKFPVFLPWSHKQKTVSSEQKKKCRTGHYPINFKGIILGPKVDTFLLELCSLAAQWKTTLVKWIFVQFQICGFCPFWKWLDLWGWVLGLSAVPLECQGIFTLFFSR